MVVGGDVCALPFCLTSARIVCAVISATVCVFVCVCVCCKCYLLKCSRWFLQVKKKIHKIEQNKGGKEKRKQTCYYHNEINSKSFCKLVQEMRIPSLPSSCVTIALSTSYHSVFNKQNVAFSKADT